MVSWRALGPGSIALDEGDCFTLICLMRKKPTRSLGSYVHELYRLRGTTVSKMTISRFFKHALPIRAGLCVPNLVPYDKFRPRRHDAEKKYCSHDGCVNQVQQGGVCVTHGAEKQCCSQDGCNNQAHIGGVYVTHGAEKKGCSHDGCANGVVKKGVLCRRHGAEKKYCSHNGCVNQVQEGGVCIAHGTKVTHRGCSHDSCANLARQGGVCVTHGTKTKRCSQDGCDNEAHIGGVCKRHGSNSLASVQYEVEQPPQPPKGCNAMTAVAITRGRGGEISVCKLQMNISLAATCQSPSLHPSATNPNFSDEDEISSWIYKSSRLARRKVF
jgi:hypothetical protein